MNELFVRNIGILSEKEQLKLRKTVVAIVGMGCTGSIVAEFLARLGVGGFILIDGDRFEYSNVNRQIHAVFGSIGHNKAVISAERILQINPDAQVEPISEYLNIDNAEQILKNSDFVVNGVDDPLSMIILHRTARYLKKHSTFILSGCVPFQGICSIIEYNNPVDYETFMGLPTKDRPIKDMRSSKKELFELITKARLNNALKRGAINGPWVTDRLNGGPMPSYGITSNIVGLIAAHETVKAIICRSGLRYVNAPNLLYFDGAKSTLDIKVPGNDNKCWFQGDF
jgi:molybdopterin/thiamine biosynthesis adenylyltransferase